MNPIYFQGETKTDIIEYTLGLLSFPTILVLMAIGSTYNQHKEDREEIRNKGLELRLKAQEKELNKYKERYEQKHF